MGISPWVILICIQFSLPHATGTVLIERFSKLDMPCLCLFRIRAIQNVELLVFVQGFAVLFVGLVSAGEIQMQLRRARPDLTDGGIFDCEVKFPRH